MNTADQVRPGSTELDTIARTFLGSDFAGPIYADWPIDRRLDAFLAHHGHRDILNNGSTYDDLLQRVMANIGLAHRRGILPRPRTWKRQ